MLEHFLIVSSWIRDWSLIMGRWEGGIQNRRGGGGACEVPMKKGGTEKALAMLKGGAQKVVG